MRNSFLPPLIFFLAAITSQAATISATATQSSYSIGDSVPVAISISNVSEIYAFEFDLSFDSAVLSAQSFMEGGYFLSNGVSFSPGTIDNRAGTISFVADSLSGASQGFTGNSVLGTALFTAIASGSTRISPLNIILLDNKLADIAANTSAIFVSVSDVTTTPEPNSLSLLGVTVAATFLGGRRMRSRFARQ